MRAIPLALALMLPVVAAADVVIATRTIRPEEVLTSADIRILPDTILGSYATAEEVLGLEARVALYAGRPIRKGDLRPPAIVGRNDLVELIYRRHGLEIIAEGRSLARAGVGELISVLNTGSRRRVTGRVLPNGRILVE